MGGRRYMGCTKARKTKIDQVKENLEKETDGEKVEKKSYKGRNYKKEPVKKITLAELREKMEKSQEKEGEEK